MSNFVELPSGKTFPSIADIARAYPEFNYQPLAVCIRAGKPYKGRVFVTSEHYIQLLETTGWLPHPDAAGKYYNVADAPEAAMDTCLKENLGYASRPSIWKG